MADIIDLQRNDAAAAERNEETAWLRRVGEQADRGAFDALFARFSPRLVAWARGQGCDAALAETVVQDVMIAAWTRAHRFDPAKASARTWLYALARNRMIDYFRARKRRERAHEALLESQVPDTPRDDADSGVRQDQLRTLLQQLPPEQRDVLLMVYLEGRSHREIAEALDIPVGTIKSRARLAFRRLRTLMEDEA